MEPAAAACATVHRRCASDSVALFEQPSSFGDCLPPERGRRTFASFDGDEMVDDDDFDIKNVGIAGVPVGAMDFDATHLDDDVSFMSVFDDDDKALQLGISGVPLGCRSNGGASLGSQGGFASIVKRGGTDLTEQLKRNQSAGVSGGAAGDNQGQGSPSESVSEVSNDGVELKPDLRLGLVKAELDIHSGSGDEEVGGGGFGGGGHGNGAAVDGGHNLSHATAEFLEQSTADGSLDPKRAKRILANRQSAQRSRVRKLQYISELERRVGLLQGEIGQLSPQVAYLDRQRVGYNNENSALKAKMAEMAQQTLFKDALNEALRKEVQNLKALQAAQLQQQQSASTSMQSSSSQSPLNVALQQSASARYTSPELSLHHNPHNISSENASRSLSFEAFAASIGSNGLGGLGTLSGFAGASQSTMTGLEQALAGLGNSRASATGGMGGLTSLQAQQLLGGGGYMVGCGNSGGSVSTGLSMSDLVMHNA
eukprot:TRINITY_DN5582_c0_g1_i2.p1 TRINITY_DN5582_c0_g1~~TRINITY_DN5582_c0_g1_i2.p1  ORF type:complete len:499 (+),score=121.65 TRINITY_DN5582_c0_g1_i2:50-1498(+)